MSRLQVFVYSVEAALIEEGYKHETETPPEWYYQNTVRRNSDTRQQYDHLESESE